jgi:serine/threonine protein kinase
MSNNASNQLKDALPIDTLLHGYNIQQVLGHGGFGITYFAVYERKGTGHAIKEYRPQGSVRASDGSLHPKSMADQADFDWGLKKFSDEASFLHKFHHPNIVKVTDMFSANNTAYFVMPYIKGINLQQWLNSNHEQDKDGLLDIFIPLLEGIKYCHEHDVLHRDIKLENIFMAQGGEPRLIDFGSAKHAIGIRTKSIHLVVSPHYSPMELYATTTKKTFATDIYSLGACMYTAITRDLTVEAPARNENDTQPRLAEMKYYVSRFGRDFLAAIDKALSVKAVDRFQSARDFQKALLGDVPIIVSEEPKKVVDDNMHQDDIDYVITGPLIGNSEPEQKAPRMTFSEAIKTTLVKKYCCFKGRASRAEFWWFFLLMVLYQLLITVIIAVIVANNSEMISEGLAFTISIITLGASLPFCLPTLGVMTRRFHDLNQSALLVILLVSISIISAISGVAPLSPSEKLWISTIAGGFNAVLSFVMLIWFAFRGTKGPNKYGHDPLERRAFPHIVTG